MNKDKNIIADSKMRMVRRQTTVKLGKREDRAERRAQERLSKKNAKKMMKKYYLAADIVGITDEKDRIRFVMDCVQRKLVVSNEWLAEQRIIHNV